MLRGKPTIRGLKISVDQIIKALAAGLGTEEILQDYPELEGDDIKAALLYASKILELDKVYRTMYNGKACFKAPFQYPTEESIVRKRIYIMNIIGNPLKYNTLEVTSSFNIF